MIRRKKNAWIIRRMRDPKQYAPVGNPIAHGKACNLGLEAHNVQLALRRA
jgi:hypothetical protein